MGRNVPTFPAQRGVDGQLLTVRVRGRFSGKEEEEEEEEEEGRLCVYG